MRLALRGDGGDRVSLDAVIETMRQTGEDMRAKYRETSVDGLAIGATSADMQDSRRTPSRLIDVADKAVKRSLPYLQGLRAETRAGDRARTNDDVVLNYQLRRRQPGERGPATSPQLGRPAQDQMKLGRFLKQSYVRFIQADRRI